MEHYYYLKRLLDDSSGKHITQRGLFVARISFVQLIVCGENMCGKEKDRDKGKGVSGGAHATKDMG